MDDELTKLIPLLEEYIQKVVTANFPGADIVDSVNLNNIREDLRKAIDEYLFLRFRS